MLSYVVSAAGLVKTNVVSEFRRFSSSEFGTNEMVRSELMETTQGHPSKNDV